ncbi:hypothetical protein AB6A40_006162 [Gnathostoma spinigerum]|uniref:Gelsolin-like domain-containing protein n=1 Tax=Gnathostoma spinigerum TaxID=75299 RepID=A0ABD6ER15_9BILA
MILDTFNKVYVWIGKGANSNEKANALDQVQKYLETDALPRDSPDVVEVHQGDEPNDFKEYFPNWDDEMFQSNARSFQAMRAAFCM